MEISLFYISLDVFWIVLIRLIISVLYGGLIGIERANSKHDAGLRTHIIVCLGATSVMIVSQLISQQNGAVTDVTRLGAQVISGIGFLGVGTIIVNKNRVRGLTTAAGLWTTGCLGLVIGAGFLEIATAIVALMMFTIYILRPFSLKIRSSAMTFEVVASISDRTITDYVEELAKRNFEILSAKTSNDKIILLAHTEMIGERNEFVHEIITIPGVTGVSEA